MSLTSWLQQWLAEHPMQEPRGAERERFTAEVMARVRALAPTPAVERAARRWPVQLVWGWPRFAVTFAAAAAGIALAIGLMREPSPRVADEIVHEAEQLAALAPPELEPLLADDAETLADDLEMADTIVLAEAQPSDETWLAQTLELLDQIEEELPSDSEGLESDEEWLEDLELLDESDLAAAS